jgi:CubicO group peptidase (beta-lactamase class C family)
MNKIYVVVLSVCALFQLNSFAQKEFLNHNFRKSFSNQDLKRDSEVNLDSLAIDSLITSYMNANSIPGLATMIIKDYQIVWDKNYGYRNLALQLPVEDSTLFLTASVSKLIVASAIMQFWEADSFDLDDNINDYLDDFQVHIPGNFNDTVTFRMIMTHTASIADNWNVLNPLTICGDSPIPLDTFLINYFTPGGTYYNTAFNFINAAPGTVYNYSNVGVSVLAYLVEKFSGMSFDQYCRENIFIPLDMNKTSWFLDGMNIDEIAIPYLGSTAICHQGWVIYPSAFLRTNKIELSNFLFAYITNGIYDNHRLLDSATINYMLSDQLGYITNSRVQGLIWHKHNAFSGKLWGHFGWWEGVETYAGLNPNERYGIIWFQNSGDPNSNFMSAQVLPQFADYAYSITTDVEGQEFTENNLPDNFILEQNYPNPFNPSTTIRYSIPTSEFVTLKVYDVLGNEVASLVDEYKPAGSYEVEFSADGLTSGIYFYKLTSGNFSQTKKMLLMK